jgi:hypothetical protein
VIVLEDVMQTRGVILGLIPSTPSSAKGWSGQPQP